MHPNLKLLIALHDLDHQLTLFEEEREHQQKLIENTKQKIRETEKKTKEIEKKEKDTLLLLKKEEEHLKEIEYKIDKKKEELFSGKFTGSKELLGFQKEMKRLEEERDQKETDIIVLMEEYEKVKKEVEETKKRSKKTIGKFEKTLSDLLEEDLKIEKELEKLYEKRKNIIKELSEKYYTMYEDIRRKKGTAIAKVKENSCTGCHLVIPQGVVDRVKEGNEIVICPHCGRILY